MSATKHDEKKLRLDLIPQLPLMEVANVYTIGAEKYADRNWEKGIAYSRIVAAIQRHLQQWLSGEKWDRENGQHHLASCVFGLFALMEYEHTHPEMNDLPPLYDSQADRINQILAGKK